MREFMNVASGARLYAGLLIACVFGSISTWIGLRFGKWMRGVQR